MAKIKYIYLLLVSQGETRWGQHIFQDDPGPTRCGVDYNPMKGDKHKWDLDPADQPTACMACNQA